jgi:hypothetical protein
MNQLPPGQFEYLRRWLLCHKAIREGRWDAVKKWAILCNNINLYECAKRLHDQGIDLSNGFI